MTTRLIALSFLSLLALSACTPVGLAIGAGATIGTAATDERGISGSMQDLSINTQIQKSWLDHDFNLFRRLNLSVREGRVLITGFVATPEQRLEAVRRAWKVSGVREVINEIELDPNDTAFDDTAHDTQIAAELKSKLTFDSNVYAVNYSIDVVRGTVYLIGVAQNQAELDRVILTARHIAYVRKIKQFVRIKSQGAPNV